MSAQTPYSGSSSATGDMSGLVRLAVGALLLLAVGLVVLGFVLWPEGGRPLYPILASPTSTDQIIDNETVLVSFEELNADPAAFRDLAIQVTGDYTPIDVPVCRPFAGPRIQWSLVADELQLNATGFERILRLVEPGISMTVTGIWRMYQGPLGCGKEPPDGAVWFLQVTQILEPNPITGQVPILLTFVPGEGGPQSGEQVPTLSGEETPELLPTATELPEIVVTIQPTGTLPVESTVPAFSTPTAALPVTPLATPGAVTPGPGTTPPVAGTPTAEGTPDPAGTPTSTAGDTATPELPTGTIPPGGYPPATSTPDSYP